MDKLHVAIARYSRRCSCRVPRPNEIEEMTVLMLVEALTAHQAEWCNDLCCLIMQIAGGRKFMRRIRHQCLSTYSDRIVAALARIGDHRRLPVIDLTWHRVNHSEKTCEGDIFLARAPYEICNIQVLGCCVFGAIRFGYLNRRLSPFATFLVWRSLLVWGRASWRPIKAGDADNPISETAHKIREAANTS